MNLDLSSIAEFSQIGRKGFSSHAMIRAFIVMKSEGFSMITDLLNYIHNNLIIAHYCGFDIFKKLPSYWTIDRFLKNFNHDFLSKIMKSQVTFLSELGILDTSFIDLDSTPISANTSHNNPKSFKKNKFKKDNQPKSDKDCKLGVHTASNQSNEKKYDFYWGYKNHILLDCITWLPIYDITTAANISDSTIALQILEETNNFTSIKERSFLADKGYDAKYIYQKLYDLYDGECFIPLNKRNTKKHKIISKGNPICDAGLLCTEMVNSLIMGEQNKSSVAHSKNPKLAYALATIQISTMERKIEVALNT